MASAMARSKILVAGFFNEEYSIYKYLYKNTRLGLGIKMYITVNLKRLTFVKISSTLDTYIRIKFLKKITNKLYLHVSVQINYIKLL